MKLSNEHANIIFRYIQVKTPAYYHYVPGLILSETLCFTLRTFPEYRKSKLSDLLKDIADLSQYVR